MIRNACCKLFATWSNLSWASFTIFYLLLMIPFAKLEALLLIRLARLLPSPPMSKLKAEEVQVASQEARAKSSVPVWYLVSMS